MKLVSKTLLIIIVSFIVDFIINNDRIKLERISAEIASLFYFSDTRYSSGYSNNKFSEVKIGMTGDEVIRILGGPISIFKPHKDSEDPKKRNRIAFQYSFSPSKSHFRVRNIIFDKEKVIKKIHCFAIND
jgi:hypothetical protein